MGKGNETKDIPIYLLLTRDFGFLETLLRNLEKKKAADKGIKQMTPDWSVKKTQYLSQMWISFGLICSEAGNLPSFQSRARDIMTRSVRLSVGRSVGP